MHPKLAEIIPDNKCPFCHASLRFNYALNEDNDYLECAGTCLVSRLELFPTESSIWIRYGNPHISLSISYPNNTLTIMMDKKTPITINAIPDDLFQSREMLEQKIKLLLTFS